MAREYKLSLIRRIANSIIKLLLRLGLGPKSTYLLTVRGRKTGKLYSTPVTLVEENSNRWLVAPYGEVGWVRNARAAGQVTLSRGKRLETVDIIELGPDESAPVLKKYIKQVAIVRPYFDAKPDSPIETFVAEAQLHPVFKIKKTK